MGPHTELDNDISFGRQPPMSRSWLLGLSVAATVAAIGGVVTLNALGPSEPHGSLAFGHVPVGINSSAPVADPSAAPAPSAPASPRHAYESGFGLRGLHDADGGAPGSTAGDLRQDAKAARPSADGSTGSVVQQAQAVAHIQASDTAYTSAALVKQAAALWSKPQALHAPRVTSAAAVTTTAGLDGCLVAIGVSAERAVVDLARFDGRPAAVIVTEGDSGRQVRVVTPQCGPSSDTVLAGPATIR